MPWVASRSWSLLRGVGPLCAWLTAFPPEARASSVVTTERTTDRGPGGTGSTGQWAPPGGRHGGDLGSGGRGTGAGRGAAQQRRDRGAAVHLGPHRREPRLLAAAQAGACRTGGRWPSARPSRPAPARSHPATGPADPADLVRRPGAGAGRAGRPDQGAPAGDRGRARRGGQDPARAGGRRGPGRRVRRRRVVRRPGPGHRPGHGRGRGRRRARPRRAAGPRPGRVGARRAGRPARPAGAGQLRAGTRRRGALPRAAARRPARG